MKTRETIRVSATGIPLLLLAMLLIAAPLVCAQTPSRIVGTITAINGNTLTVQADTGQVYQVEVPSTATLRRITPGQRTLSGAETIQFSDLANGDRALVRTSPTASAGTLQAVAVIAIRLTDLERREQQERAEWRLRGVGGVVKSVDSASGTIMLISRAGTAPETITVHITPSTILERYAPNSLRFDLAQPAPIAAIHVGDQLMARGAKSVDGTEVTAEEVVSGSFRHISGTIASLDSGNSTLVVKDIATKKQVTIHIQPDTQMHRLSERVAQILAARLKGEAVGGGNSGSIQGSGAGAMSTQMLLRRAPQIDFAELQKGGAVMLVATQGTSEVTAITLMAGVGPLLVASEANRQDLLSGWSMDTGVGETTEAPQ